MTSFTPPKRFELGGITVKVKQNPELMKTTGAFGVAIFNEGEIHLDTKSHPVDIQAITFLHEKIHFILFTMGNQELCQDEEFVDTFASLLWQSMKTERY
jgi:hypothetical protein